MKRQRNLMIWVTLLAFTACVGGCGGGSTDSESGDGSTVAAEQGGKGSAKVGGQVGNRAPDFELVNLQGDTIRLSDLSGDVIVLDFWATWCAPCKMAMPHLQEIHEEYGDKGVTIVAVSVDTKGEKVVRPFIEKAGYTFHVAMNDKGLDRKLGGFRGVPTTFVIGPDGKIILRYTGYQAKSALLDVIKSVRPELFS